MPRSLERTIFKQGSTTYYWSSKLFTKHVRQDVFKLYSFVRTADDYVDQVPADEKGFQELCNFWRNPKSDQTLNSRIASNMHELQNQYGFDRQLVNSFLDAMRSDLVHKKYQTLDDSLKYAYGSAEVIGLIMAKIMRLPDEACEAARIQGRAMQWLNFIRDLEEDNELGRQYFPVEDLERFKLADLSYHTAMQNPDRFQKFMQFQIDRFIKWQVEAEAGYRYIPKRHLIPIKTAADIYIWTAEHISQDPFIVFKQKIKPKKARIMGTAIKNYLSRKQFS
jgi:15-cis-phytoene synthase